MSLPTTNAAVYGDGAAADRPDHSVAAGLFERVFVINLSRRPDRWQQFKAGLPLDWPFGAPERVAGMDGSLVRAPDSWRSGDGAWGCYRSHLRIFETCLNERIESVLILEDDAICCDDFTRLTEVFLAHLPQDWSLLYLGGQHLDCGRALPLRVNEFVYRPFNVNRCHAYAIKGRDAIERVYHHLLSHDRWDSRHHIDHRLGELQKDHYPGIYVPHQWLVQQRDGKSDINGDHHHTTDFAGAEVLAAEQVNHRIVAILGPPSAAAAEIARILTELGVTMSRRNDLHADAAVMEDGQLRDACNEIFSQPLYVRKEGRSRCVQRLRRWAVSRSYMLRNSAGYVGSYHPALCLLGPEILEAWPDPRFLVVLNSLSADNSGTETDRFVARTLVEARERFLVDYRPLALRIGADDLTRDPAQVRELIRIFLG